MAFNPALILDLVAHPGKGNGSNDPSTSGGPGAASDRIKKSFIDFGNSNNGNSNNDAKTRESFKIAGSFLNTRGSVMSGSQHGSDSNNNNREGNSNTSPARRRMGLLGVGSIQSSVKSKGDDFLQVEVD